MLSKKAVKMFKILPDMWFCLTRHWRPRYVTLPNILIYQEILFIHCSHNQLCFVCDTNTVVDPRATCLKTANIRCDQTWTLCWRLTSPHLLIPMIPFKKMFLTFLWTEATHIYNLSQGVYYKVFREVLL